MLEKRTRVGVDKIIEGFVAPLLLADIDVSTDPAISISRRITQRNRAGQERAIVARPAAERKLELQRSAIAQGLRPMKTHFRQCGGIEQGEPGGVN